MKKNLIVVVGCLVALTLSGCTAGTTTTPVSPGEAGARVASWLSEHGEPSWSDCPSEEVPELDAEQYPELEGVETTCGTIAAPIDWSRPATSASVDLSIIRVSKGGSHDAVLMVNPGGPGASARDMALGLATVPDAAPLFRTYDLVGIEPRGLTPATDLGCDLEGSAADGEGAVEACSTAGPFATHASTTDVVMDHELLRQALDQPEFDYYGASYGTYIGSVYATLFPGTVGRMVLDGIADTVSLNRTSDLPGFEASVGRLLEACTSGELGACPFTGDRDEASAQLTALFEALTADPRTTTGPDGEPAEVGGEELASYLVTRMYEPRSSWRETVEVLAGAAAGDPGSLEIVASTGDSVVDRALEYAVYCAVPPVPGATDAGAQPEETSGPLGSVDDEGGSARDCDRWGEYDRLDPLLSYGTGNRILIVSNLHDPATPHADALRLHETELTNSTLVEVDEDGHGALYRESPCATAIANAYLVSGVLPADGTRCESGS
ncbi:alpha/beta fold hydrolase [Rathayibacter sp. VKM Ac-2856]|uniref:alpha/beta fold hydrolase n=1 Tax=unclassified Rathayibacter TaxID=2609250 RepID=UPI00156429BA|nr:MULTISPECIES: alpha/beta hydrolase [unclassified Rathayibacter]NQX03811.1 alpha/beta fold hydrolase [Rathayibacter sp. VKM Ac-2858]NQX18979.1 alpha/beta fold hydrolase [Rathayibacter sp. VKM Ac-2856]